METAPKPQWPIGRLLTPQEVAERLSVNVGTVYSWAHRGSLPLIRLSGKCWRISEPVLLEWLRRRVE